MAENVSCPLTIPDLFKDKSVLVTGANGFLGKVLLEKLLRSCPDIKMLYILRSPAKKGRVRIILNKFLEENVFDTLRSERSNALKKIKLLPGNVTEENFNLNRWQLQQITPEVSFIFNCTEDLEFDEELDKALSISLLGAKNIVEFSKLCKNLEALVHVSSAYSFCNNLEIFEKLYHEEATPQQILEARLGLNREDLRKLCVDNIRGRPEPNNFAQALAEILIAESGNSLPVIIVRPSIVTASVREPFPGWIDGNGGLTSLIIMCGKGIVKTLHIKPNVIADLVPVDIVANTLIVAAHYIAVKSKCEDMTDKLSSPDGVPIIHCTCPDDNSITWREIMDIWFPFLVMYPTADVYDKPGGVVTSYRFLHVICRFLSHYLPSLIADAYLFSMLHQPQFISLYKTFHEFMDYMQCFTTHSFVFHSPNMHRLKEQMEPADREIFPIDQSRLDWNLYVENYVLGVRLHMLKDNEETLPVARVTMMRMYYRWKIAKISTMVAIMSICAWKFYGMPMNPDFHLLSAGRFLAHKFGFFVAK